MNRTIRPARRFDTFSRGASLVRDIRAMWVINNRGSVDNAAINARIQAVREEFDLTLDEWHYWAEQASA